MISFCGRVYMTVHDCGSVRENVCNISEKRKKSCFWIFKKNV